MNKLIKVSRWLMVVGVVSGFGYLYQPLWLLTTAGAAPAEGGFAMPVEAAMVRRDEWVEVVEVIANLRANEAVVIRPEFEGKVSAIHFEEGQRVTVGERLLTLDGSIYMAELDQQIARAQLSKTNDQRVKSLRRQGLSSEKEQDQSSSELLVNSAAVALARTRLSKMTLSAPFSGVVGLRQVSVGDYLNRGQDIVSLLDLSVMKVDFRVPQRILARLAVGQAITLTVDSYPGERFSGEVYAIDPQVDLNGRNVQLRARVENRDGRLKAGLFGTLQLTVDRHQGLLIPEQALVPQGEKRTVYRIIDGKAQQVEVEIGLRRQGEVEVISGLKEGDQVVTAGQLKIRDGAAIMPLPADAGER